jgi:hypothetical protein
LKNQMTKDAKSTEDFSWIARSAVFAPTVRTLHNQRCDDSALETRELVSSPGGTGSPQ